MRQISPNRVPAYTPPSNTYPTVSFDIGLGKVVSSIDFDYQEFVTYMRSQGLRPREIARTSVVFTPRRTLNPLYGVYTPDNREIRVGIGKGDTSSEINSTLTHEAWHRVQDTRGELDGADGALDKMQNSLFVFGALAEVAGTAVAWGDLLLNGGQNHHNVASVTNIVRTCGAAAMVGAGIVYFGLSPTERAARKAEKHPMKAISLRKRSLRTALAGSK